MEIKTQAYTKVIDMELFQPESRMIVKEFLCPLCGGVFYNPVIDPCNHVFCSHCLVVYLKNNAAVCPITNQGFNLSSEDLELPNISKVAQSAPDFFSSIINKQKLSCIKRDCKWIGELAKLYDHINTECMFVFIKCVNKIRGCPHAFTRKNIEEHANLCNYKLIECKDCGESIIRSERDSHQEKCKKMSCPLGCGEKVLIEDLNNHASEICKNSTITCEFSFYGCECRVLRKDLSNHLHEEKKTHISLVVAFQQNLLKNVKDLGVKIRECHEANEQLIKSRPIGSKGHLVTVYGIKDTTAAIVEELEAIKTDIGFKRRKGKYSKQDIQENESILFLKNKRSTLEQEYDLNSTSD